jgi:hypothetical protein
VVMLSVSIVDLAQVPVLPCRDLTRSSSSTSTYQTFRKVINLEVSLFVSLTSVYIFLLYS